MQPWTACTRAPRQMMQCSGCVHCRMQPQAAGRYQVGIARAEQASHAARLGASQHVLPAACTLLNVTHLNVHKSKPAENSALRIVFTAECQCLVECGLNGQGHTMHEVAVTKTSLGELSGSLRNLRKIYARCLRIHAGLQGDQNLPALADRKVQCGSQFGCNSDSHAPASSNLP